MRKPKKIITVLAAAAVTASMGAVSASDLITPVSPSAEAEIGTENIFTYTFHLLKNFANLCKDGENVTVTFTAPEDADVTYTEDANITYITEGVEQAEAVPYIIKTENGKALISSDNGKTWTEVEFETQTSDSISVE